MEADDYIAEALRRIEAKLDKHIVDSHDFITWRQFGFGLTAAGLLSGVVFGLVGLF